VESYSSAARPIQDLADPENAKEVAAGQEIAQMAGMRGLASLWVEEWVRANAAPQ